MADIIWLDTTDSTNNDAAKALPTLDNLSIIAAMEQTAGRGQGDHKWHSKPGENLTFSAVLKFATKVVSPVSAPGGEQLANLHVKDAILITELTTRALREYFLDYGIQARIKWHNDIYVEGMKICGILIENTLSGEEVAASVIGIGVDINQTEFPSDLPNPVSLATLTGKRYDIKEELIKIQEKLRESAAMTCSASGREELDRYFRTYAFNIPEGF